MALHDYRKLIDDLHTVGGQTFALAVEVVDPPARSNENSMIRLEPLAWSGDGFDPLLLTEFDAGALYDALGGALRTITGTTEVTR